MQKKYDVVMPKLRRQPDRVFLEQLNGTVRAMAATSEKLSYFSSIL